MDPKERVICIPDDSLPYEIPGFPNYKQHGAAQNDELEEKVRKLKEKYAETESNLHSNLSCVLKKKVRHSHKCCVNCFQMCICCHKFVLLL
jgi:hypothetical protein